MDLMDGMDIFFTSIKSILSISSIKSKFHPAPVHPRSLPKIRADKLEGNGISPNRHSARGIFRKNAAKNSTGDAVNLANLVNGYVNFVPTYKRRRFG